MFNQTLGYNANSTLALSGGLPQMSNTLTSWLIPLELEKITQDVVNGDVVETSTKIAFRGVFQPLKAEMLQFKPENLRSWSWYWIHAQAGTLNLQTQDKIIFNGERFKVMAVKDFSLYGYVEYEVIRDYESEE